MESRGAAQASRTKVFNKEWDMIEARYIPHTRLQKSQNAPNNILLRMKLTSLTPGEVSLPCTMVHSPGGQFQALRRVGIDRNTRIPQTLGLNSPAVKASNHKAEWKIGHWNSKSGQSGGASSLSFKIYDGCIFLERQALIPECPPQ